MKKAPWPVPVIAMAVITYGLARFCATWLSLAISQRGILWLWDYNHWLWIGRTWIAIALSTVILVAAWRKYRKDSVSWTTAIAHIIIAALVVLFRISTWA